MGAKCAYVRSVAKRLISGGSNPDVGRQTDAAFAEALS